MPRSLAEPWRSNPKPPPRPSRQNRLTFLIPWGRIYYRNQTGQLFVGKVECHPSHRERGGVPTIGTTLMKRPVLSHTHCPASPAAVTRRSGYTLVEIMVATALSLLLLGAVIRMFGDVGQSITDSRAMLEVSDRLRLVATRLQQDLAGVTVTMNPPRRPENNEGYFEYIEGPVTQATGSAVSVNTQAGAATPSDTTVGDFDDVLMFTTRSTGRPFVGRYNVNQTVQSDVAEVAWFVRGRTLYRRSLLVAPASFTSATSTGFYKDNDISVHASSATTVVPNTLGDLTKRENRFAHNTMTFPYDVSGWSWLPSVPGASPWQSSHSYVLGAVVTPPTPNNHSYLCIFTTGTSGGTQPTWPINGSSVTDGNVVWKDLLVPTLPTLHECSSTSWIAGGTPPPGTRPTVPTLDLWSNDPTKRVADDAMMVPLGFTSGPRIADDVILTNVIGFDVKAWDPTYVDPVTGTTGGYVDLGNGVNGRFSGNGQTVGYINAGGWSAKTLPDVYDTWSTHYEDVGTFAGDTRAGRTTTASMTQLWNLASAERRMALWTTTPKS